MSHIKRDPMKFSQMKTVSDEDLMQLVQQGNHDAFASIFDRHYRLVLSVALRILRENAEAEDVMQNVFFEVYRKAGTFDPAKGTLKAWLLQYAYHRSLSRREYLERRNFAKSEQPLEADSYGVSREATNSWRGPTSVESGYLVRECLQSLDRKQRETLELAFFDGFSLHEIARRTNQSFANIRHYYYRGLKKMKESLLSQPKEREQNVGSNSEAFDG